MTPRIFIGGGLLLSLVLVVSFGIFIFERQFRASLVNPSDAIPVESAIGTSTLTTVDAAIDARDMLNKHEQTLVDELQ